ncbi:MAG: hypothetical protein ABEK04_05390, partial [Candidatus Nanohalobium sp.]
VNPSIDVDDDAGDEANFTGRLIPGNSKTVSLENLSTGVNIANFSTKNGAFDAEINYTEVLVPNKKPKVDVNSSGKFRTTFSVPKSSGKLNLRYYTTNAGGIQGFAQTSISSSLLFTSSNVSDLENGDRVVDPKNSFEVNATLESHSNPIDKMWALIQTPGGNTYEGVLTKTAYSGDIWNLTRSLKPNIFDKEGQYSISLNANDTEGLRELTSPTLSFNVTNGTVSVEKDEQVVGLSRKFNLSGIVRQNLTGERVNATVNITLPATGETDIVQTNDTGFYKTTLEAPNSVGTYRITVKSEDEDNITASNLTSIDVKDNTGFTFSAPQNNIEVLGVTLDQGQNKTFNINVTNTGETEIKDLKVFLEDLPTKYDGAGGVLINQGGENWTSINRTYDVPDGVKRTVEAKFHASEASSVGEYS